VPFDPKLIEARLALDLIASADMPSIAIDALEVGLDGPAIRRLAALEKPSYFEVRDLLTPALAEMRLLKIPAGLASLRLAAQIAREALPDEKGYLRRLYELHWLWIKAGYPKESREAGTLYDDVSVAEFTGQSEEKIRDWVRARLEGLIQQAAEADVK
jgi:hypothetical protein